MVAAIAPSTLIDLGQQEAAIKYQEDYDGGWTNLNKYARETPGMAEYDGQSYCVIGLLWLAYRAGDITIMPQTPACDEVVSTYQSWNRWSWFPAYGAQVMIGTEGQNHTGLVYQYSDTQIWTVEFNTNTTGAAEGDGVYLRVRSRSDANVYGYGYPRYCAPMMTADPDWVDDPALLKTSDGAAPAFVPYPGPDWFMTGRTSPLVLAMGTRLVAAGYGSHYTSGPSADLGSSDLANFADFVAGTGNPGGAWTGVPTEAAWRALQVPHSH
ncbi:peptidoglycan-binding protein [Streptomyces murinus]